MDEIKIVPYDPKWAELFEQESKTLHQSFTDEKITVEHIGSTSVIGLDAKPIIDIMIGFENLKSDEIVKKIEALGYEHWHEDPFRSERLFFTKWDIDKKNRLVHIHAATVGNRFWEDQLKFRNALRTHPEIAEEYMSLKKDLAEKFKEDRDGYTTAKTEFVRHILAQMKR